MRYKAIRKRNRRVKVKKGFLRNFTKKQIVSC